MADYHSILFEQKTMTQTTLNKHKNIEQWVLRLLCLFFILEMSFLLLNRRANIFIEQRHQLINEQDFQSQNQNTRFIYPQSYQDDFISLLPNAIKSIEEHHTIESAIKIREFMLNEGDTKKQAMIGDPKSLLLGIRQGKKLTCDSLSTLYAYMLDSLGFRVRKIYFSRSLFDQWDTHTTVEIWDEQRKQWVLSDPTFNISLKYQGSFLSVLDLYKHVHGGKIKEIEIADGAPSTYEYSLNTYYISYFSLIDNISTVKLWNYPKNITRLPPFKWFSTDYNTFLLNTKNFPIKSREFEIVNTMGFTMIVFLPTSIVLLCLIYSGLVISRLKRKKTQS